ncbi:hypothetical protein DPEC_G00376950 [Dallia pectoralis]|nr:hypothetical protein DPEC_G00376950 [Dallia pectoralis]
MPRKGKRSHAAKLRYAKLDFSDQHFQSAELHSSIGVMEVGDSEPAQEEFRWPEVITAIKAQQGQQVDFAELDWAENVTFSEANPVTTMRMFDKRIDALMTQLLLGPAQPIGEVIDYFYRVEFQAEEPSYTLSLLGSRSSCLRRRS